MSLPVTLIILAVAAGAFAWSYREHGKPYEPGGRWRPPHIGIMMVTFIVMLLMAAHLITLLTGTPFTGRRGF